MEHCLKALVDSWPAQILWTDYPHPDGFFRGAGDGGKLIEGRAARNGQPGHGWRRKRVLRPALTTGGRRRPAHASRFRWARGDQDAAAAMRTR